MIYNIRTKTCVHLCTHDFQEYFFVGLHTHARTFTHTHARTFTHTQARTQTCIHMHTPAYTVTLTKAYFTHMFLHAYMHLRLIALILSLTYTNIFISKCIAAARRECEKMGGKC